MLTTPLTSLAPHRLSSSALDWSGRALWRQKPLLMILGIGLAVRLVLLWSVANLPLKIVDEQHYHQLATSIRSGHGFALASGRLTSIRPPLYPAFIAAVWTLTGTESPQAIRGVQVLLALTNTVVLYYLGLLLFDRRVATVAASAFCLYPSLLFNGVLLLTETLFTMLLTLVVLGYVLMLRRLSAPLALVTGCALGLAALTRSVLWPFPLLLCPLVLWSASGRMRTRIAVSAFIFVGYILVVLPWAVRNTRLQGVLTVVDTMGGMNLRMGNYAYTPTDRMWDAVDIEGEKSWAVELGREHPEALTWTEGQKEKWARSKALAYMFDHPLVTLERSAIRLADFWGLERELAAAFAQRVYTPPGWVAALALAAVMLSYCALMVLASLGVYFAPPTDRRIHTFLVLLIAFVCGVHTVVFGHSRYHLPLIPILALYASAALVYRSWPRSRVGLTVAAGPVITIATLLAIWAREVLIRDAARLRQLLSILG